VVPEVAENRNKVAKKIWPCYNINQINVLRLAASFAFAKSALPQACG
jgi:hypothetical protein